ncbi:MAG: tRNA (adenosine(37)-N6)-dimethylallyltransferase MiaA [Holosporaceae bacterium]|jgi:tRNA dimethylallyltransferase|nr:tRNA (adenosine(37)-N6)-dimethylallyltransferase MiaA [Holosporaceae bacterium]
MLKKNDGIVKKRKMHYRFKNLVVAGLTASGKSFLAEKCAQQLKDRWGIIAEIINADSIQLYNELKTLTAYPVDTQSIAHHLYGILSPNEVSSAAFWRKLAIQKINELRQEGKIAIICGGTGFYIGALINGISDIPQIPQVFRKQTKEKFQILGRERFFDQLSKLDPELCKTLHKNNTQRILRAYEVAAFTGKSISEWWKNDGEKSLNGSIITLLPPRDKLGERCRARVKSMIEAGGVGEVEDFLRRYPDYKGPLQKVIGYEEIISFLKGNISLDECMNLMYIKTMQYAKRQSVWFRYQLKKSKILSGFGDEIELDSLISALPKK